MEKKKPKKNRNPCNFPPFFLGFSLVCATMPRKKKGDDTVQPGNIRQFFQQTTTPMRDITNNETAQNLAAAPRARPSSTRSLKFDQISSGHAAERMQEEDINYSGICRCLCVVHLCSPCSRKLSAQERTRKTKKKKKRTITIVNS